MYSDGMVFSNDGKRNLTVFAPSVSHAPTGFTAVVTGWAFPSATSVTAVRSGFALAAAQTGFLVERAIRGVGASLSHGE